jgi:radical SAM superfamily enzyme YgiQ (UPF0313 family)
MKKGVTVEQAEKAIETVRSAGFEARGSFMFGYPGETRETVAETVDFIKRNKLPPRPLFYTTAYPRTPLYEIAKTKNEFPREEEEYIESLGEMTDNLLINFTDIGREELVAVKKEAERKVIKNAPLNEKVKILKKKIISKYINARKRGWRASFKKLIKFVFTGKK